MSFNFKQKYGGWALVTGATSGIGEQMAQQLAEDGMNLVLVARREQELKDYAQKLATQYSIETDVIVADLSTQQGVDEIKATQHDIGLVALSAGLETNGAFEKLDLAVERQLLQVNVNSVVDLSHHFSNTMIVRGKGGILLVASMFGQMASPYFSTYAGSKAFVINFGQSLYGELKSKGVDVSILSPGLTKTPMAVSTGVNWNKVPMAARSAEKVAKVGLQGVGKRVLTVPGLRNNIMAFMADLTPRKMMSLSMQKILNAALDAKRL
ncbi:SDR family NAD(P)-dependent oxidoreductase [Motilimonas pumila]|uniref:SDR family NAD(P)-dependent oxidoreductase n=1 Tax=Motilimonas pumila TaxID=2303987 RepID=A0A418YD51_9GAMM|nr:SDR family NAD(P)-dependent oxidoreductase [Motilimonas pumila]RJG42444.1 SDR family NAD(P)-dependent oxidoreductase [Motilimonas pumila]